MLSRFKNNRFIDRIIHHLSLHAVLKETINNKMIEISDNGSFFPEIRGQKITNFNSQISDQLVLLHTPKLETIKLLASKLTVNQLIILTHNKYTLDFFLQFISNVFGLSNYDLSRFSTSNELRTVLEANNYMVISERGSFFGSKLIMIFLPNILVKKATKLFVYLDYRFSNSFFKHLMRNRVVVAKSYYNDNQLKSKINSKYAQMSLDFDHLYNDSTPQGKSYLRNVAKLIKMMDVKKADSILDIGVGTGTYSIESAKRGAKVVGYDISEEMLKLTRAKIKNTKLNIALVQGDAENLPFKRESFDKIVTASVPHDVNNFDEFISQLSRVLKEDGKIFMNIYNPYSVAGIVTFIRIKLGLHPEINILPLTYVRRILKDHNLKITKVSGIELLQGIPLPWSFKWGFVNNFDNFDKWLSDSVFSYLYSQYILEIEKINGK